MSDIAIRILADPNICEQAEFLNHAEELLFTLLQQFCKLYDEKFLIHNLHGVYPKHLVKDSKLYRTSL